MHNKTILISGANSGIGYACVKYFLANNFFVTGLDIHSSNLQEYAINHPNFKFVEIDLNESDSIQHLFSHLDEHNFYPDILKCCWY